MTIGNITTTSFLDRSISPLNSLSTKSLNSPRAVTDSKTSSLSKLIHTFSSDPLEGSELVEISKEVFMGTVIYAVIGIAAKVFFPATAKAFLITGAIVITAYLGCRLIGTGVKVGTNALTESWAKGWKKIVTDPKITWENSKTRERNMKELQQLNTQTVAGCLVLAISALAIKLFAPPESQPVLIGTTIALGYIGITCMTFKVILTSIEHIFTSPLEFFSENLKSRKNQMN